VITGAVSTDGLLAIRLRVGNRSWRAIIDTGFNGDLELPTSLRPIVNARFKGRYRSLLASGQEVEEDTYRVTIPFDGRRVVAEATFVSGGEILVGTHMLRRFRLQADFVRRIVTLERVG
jgi:predicted aspartyl protease